MNRPSLTEPGVRYFIGETLKNCSKHKFEYNNTLLNTGLFILFFSILGIVVYFSYKNKQEDTDKELENEKKQQYVLNMVKHMNDKQLRKHGDKITDLPEFESEFELTMKKFL